MTLKLPRVSIITSDSKGNGVQGEFSTLSLGMGFHRAWTYLTLFCSTSVFTAPIAFSSSQTSLTINCFYLVCVILSIVVLFAASAFSSRARSFLLGDKTIGVATLTCSIGTIALLGCGFAGDAGIILAVLAGLLCGISNAILILLWGMSYARYETMTIVINTTVSIFIAVLLFALLSYCIPSPIGAALTVLLPLAEIPFLQRNLHPRSKRIIDLPKPNLLPTNKRVLGARLAVPVLLFGYALGVVRFFATEAVNLQTDATVFFLALFVAGVLMVLVLVVLFYFTESQADESLMRYMIPVLVLAMIFLPLPSVAGSSIAAPLLLTAYLCFKAIIWIFLCGMCQRFRLSPIFVIGVGFGSMALGSFLASISLAFNETIVSLTPFGSNTLIILAIIAMVVAYALLPRTADIAKAVTGESISEQAGKRNAANEHAVSATQEAGERDVQVLNAAGRHASPAKTDQVESVVPNVSQPAAPQSDVPQEPAQDACEPPAPVFTAASSTANASPQEPSLDSADAFKEQCDIISNRYLLSRRESEVLYLLARGHNAAYIQDKLCVAQSTTKTHIYHIYQKLNIHTQQELITMVIENMESSN